MRHMGRTLPTPPAFREGCHSVVATDVDCLFISHGCVARIERIARNGTDYTVPLAERRSGQRHG